jgi:hypothetical protein
LNQKDTIDLNKSIMSNKIIIVIKKKTLPAQESPEPVEFTTEFFTRPLKN